MGSSKCLPSTEVSGVFVRIPLPYLDTYAWLACSSPATAGRAEGDGDGADHPGKIPGNGATSTCIYP